MSSNFSQESLATRLINQLYREQLAEEAQRQAGDDFDPELFGELSLSSVTRDARLSNAGRSCK